MGLLGRLSRMFSPSQRSTGYPTSSNRASSFHLWWTGIGPVEWAEVTLEVVHPPAVPRLYFWALQASFVGEAGRSGGAHLGIQWHPGHPGSTAVNWGGYRAGGGLLDGTDSALPSSTRNANTRDFSWFPERPYRLRIAPAGPSGSWSGVVTDVSTGEETEVRRLHGGGSRLVDLVVWSEVFARCDDPSVVVRWSHPLTSSGPPQGYRVSYQPVERGGCSNTDVQAAEEGVLQITNQARSLPDGATVPLRGSP